MDVVHERQNASGKVVSVAIAKIKICIAFVRTNNFLHYIHNHRPYQLSTNSIKILVWSCVTFYNFLKAIFETGNKNEPICLSVLLARCMMTFFIIVFFNGTI